MQLSLSQHSRVGVCSFSKAKNGDEKHPLSPFASKKVWQSAKYDFGTCLCQEKVCLSLEDDPAKDDQDTSLGQEQVRQSTEDDPDTNLSQEQACLSLQADPAKDDLDTSLSQEQVHLSVEENRVGWP